MSASRGETLLALAMRPHLSSPPRRSVVKGRSPSSSRRCSSGGGGGSVEPSPPSSSPSSSAPPRQTGALSFVKGKVMPLRELGKVSAAPSFHRRDMVLLRRACLLSTSSQGEVAPFPCSGCVLVTRKSKVAAETYQYASGTEPAELQAIALAGGDRCESSTLYLNLEPCHALGQEDAVRSILDSQVKRVVVGMENPLVHLRGRAIAALREAGVRVDCLRSHLAAEMEDLEERGASGEASSGFLDFGGDTLEAEMVRTLKLCFEVKNARLLANGSYCIRITGNEVDVAAKCE